MVSHTYTHTYTHSLSLSLSLSPTQDYYRSGRMLVRLAQAIGRLVLAGRELTRLAGYVQYHHHTTLYIPSHCVCVCLCVFVCVCVCVCVSPHNNALGTQHVCQNYLWY